MSAPGWNKVARLISLLGFALLFLSSLSPWAVIHRPDGSTREYGVFELASSLAVIQADYGIIDGNAGLLYLIIILLMASLITAGASVIWTPLSLLSGGMGLMCAGFWLALIWTLRERLEGVGGAVLHSSLELGSGPTLVILGSLILLASFVLSLRMRISRSVSGSGGWLSPPVS